MATAPEASSAEGVPQAMQFAGLLEQSRDLISERLDQAVAGMLNDAKDTLTTLIRETRNFEERRHYEEAKGVVTVQRDVMGKAFKSSYLTEFRRRSDRARKIGQPSGESDDLLQLELIGEDDYEETLKFNNMAAKLRDYCDEELVALDQRVGVLLGDANLQPNDNPFSPQLICNAYKHACRQVDVDAHVRRVLFKLFDDHVLDDVRSMYKAVNGLLVQNAILPKIRYTFSRSHDRRGPARGVQAIAGTPGEDPPSDITTNVAQDFFAILQNLAATSALGMGQPGVGRQAGLPAGSPGSEAAMLQGAELQTSLTRIQRGDLTGVAGGNFIATTGGLGTINVLRELKATSLGAGMGSMDLMTLDIVAMLFDQLFDDPKVPNEIKALAGRLQIPILKVTIADKTFFSTKTHPARRLIDTMGDVASRMPADFSPTHPLFARLQSIVQEVVDGFKDDMAIFTRAREQLEALLAEEDRRIEEENLAKARRIEQMEALAVAKRAAAEEVKSRVQNHQVPSRLVDFLAQQWLKLLLLIHVREGRESRAWQGALQVMDRLIWSVEPKTTQEARSALIARIPGLVKQLAAGLKAASIEDEVRSQFFSELIQYHKQAISGPTEDQPDPASAAQPEPGQTGRANAEAAASLDFTAPVTVKNPFGGGDVQVENLDLDFTSLEAGGTRTSPKVNPLSNLVVGTWVGFRDTIEQPVRRPAKLIFVTPRKTRYLFAFDRAGKDILPFTPGELSRRFRLGDAAFINEPGPESLFDRIMKGLVGKLRAAPR